MSIWKILLVGFSLEYMSSLLLILGLVFSRCGTVLKSNQRADCYYYNFHVTITQMGSIYWASHCYWKDTELGKTIADFSTPVACIASSGHTTVKASDLTYSYNLYPFIYVLFYNLFHLHQPPLLFLVELSHCCYSASTHPVFWTLGKGKNIHSQGLHKHMKNKTK